LPDNHERIMQERSFEASLEGGTPCPEGRYNINNNRRYS
jgi:hypothetical protein